MNFIHIYLIFIGILYYNDYWVGSGRWAEKRNRQKKKSCGLIFFHTLNNKIIIMYNNRFHIRAHIRVYMQLYEAGLNERRKIWNSCFLVRARRYFSLIDASRLRQILLLSSLLWLLFYHILLLTLLLLMLWWVRIDLLDASFLSIPLRLFCEPGKRWIEKSELIHVFGMRADEYETRLRYIYSVCFAAKLAFDRH